MRDMRKAHNRELSDVANALRIRQVYLQAIEDGRFDDLPGPTYAAGFVRAYADYLGLELDEVMRRYRSATGDIPTQTPLVPPSPMAEARLPTRIILLVAAILAAGAYGGWYYLTVHGQSPTEVVSALPKRISDAVGLSDKSTTKSPSSEVTKSSATAPVAKSPIATSVAKVPTEPKMVEPEQIAESSTAVSENPASPAQMADPAMSKVVDGIDVKKPVVVIQAKPPIDLTVEAPANNSVAVAAETPAGDSGSPQAAAPAPTAAETVNTAKPPETMTEQTPLKKEVVTVPEKIEVAEPPKPDVPQVASVPTQQILESRIVLRATVTSWVELRDADGKRLLSRLLRAGETYKVPGRTGILFTTGNAGGVDILVDGQPIAALGPVGAVRRDIPMDAKTLRTRKPGQR